MNGLSVSSNFAHESAIKMDSEISEFTAHTVGLRYNGRYLKQIIDLHLDERTVPRAKNWTTVSSAFNLFSFLGGFLKTGTELRAVNSLNQKIFVHKLATGRNGGINADDGNLLMNCELLVGARGFEPPTSRSLMIGAAKT